MWQAYLVNRPWFCPELLTSVLAAHLSRMIAVRDGRVSRVSRINGICLMLVPSWHETKQGAGNLHETDA